jgi:6-pyruvoyltetrahydropterin/6-carboxytetrahydropterin synthase
MVMDFGDVKAIAKQQVVDVWDHAFLAYRGDTAVVDFLQSMPGHKTVHPRRGAHRREPRRRSLPHPRPGTAIYGNHLRLERVRLYETPNCWADALRADAWTATR